MKLIAGNSWHTHAYSRCIPRFSWFRTEELRNYIGARLVEDLPNYKLTICGGSWRADTERQRSAFRRNGHRGIGYYALGFRLVEGL